VVDLLITQPGWGCVGSPFLMSNRVRPTLLLPCKRLPRTWTARRKRIRGIRRLAWEAYISCVLDFPLHGVHRLESP
jgi:hypothetical protein